VRFTTAEEDAQRRDFTINGLFLDPVDNRVIDYVGGQEDLKSKTIRAIGDPEARFREDHLRMLRAIRFAARLGFSIAPRTSGAIQHHAQHLTRISPERIGEESRLMLQPRTRIDAFRLLRELGPLGVIMRFLPEKPTHRPEETTSLFLALGPPLSEGPIGFGLSLAALTLDFRLNIAGSHDVRALISPIEAKRSVHAMRQALKISNEESDAMLESLSFSTLISSHPTVASMKRFLAGRGSADARLLMQALARCGMLTDEVNSLLPKLEQLEQAGDIAPDPLLTGDDLVAAGWRPGRLFKTVLNDVYDAQLEHRIHSKDEALRLAESLKSAS